MVYRKDLSREESPEPGPEPRQSGYNSQTAIHGRFPTNTDCTTRRPSSRQPLGERQFDVMTMMSFSPKQISCTNGEIYLYFSMRFSCDIVTASFQIQQHSRERSFRGDVRPPHCTGHEHGAADLSGAKGLFNTASFPFCNQSAQQHQAERWTRHTKCPPNERFLHRKEVDQKI